MIPFIYKQGREGRAGSITLNLNGKPYSFTESHGNFKQIVQALMNGAWSKIADLIDIKKAIAKYTNGKVEILDSGELHYDGAPLHNALTTRILDAYNGGGDFEFLTNFLNNLQSNPIQSARDEVYLFLDACNLPITEDGHFLAYKVVNNDYTDCYTGKFDNSIGTEPEMKPEDCDTDRNNHCSRGLHFCSRSYISQFHNGDRRLMMVKVNPANVVSIPSDYNNAKGRAWKYKVVGELGLADEIPNNVTKKDVKLDLKPTASDRKATKSATVTRAAGSKLTESDVLDIRKMVGEGFSYAVVGAKFGVHRRTIERIAKGDAWKHVKAKDTKPALKGGSINAKDSAKIRKLRSSGRSLQSLADEFGCSRHRIEKICNN